jgi:protease I
MAGLEGKKVLLTIASKDFRDEELYEPMALLKDNGAAITIASSSLEESTGMMGGTAQPEVLVTDVNVDDYDAIVFVGGYGAQEYFESPVAHTIAQATAEKDKLLCAICISPSILANAGLLEGRKATCYECEAENLQAKGAEFTGSNVEVDGNIITADGPDSAAQFGQAIVDKLSG